MAKQQFFVFAKCERGRTYEAGRRVVKEVPNVVEVSSISGKWDLLIKIVVDPNEDVGQIINERLAAIESIRKTKTQVAYFVYNPDDVFF